MAQLYGFTPQESADMTPEQQYALLTDDPDDDTGSNTITFRTHKEYMDWLKRRK